MPANVDAMVREGVSAFKAGNKEDARAFLMKAVELDQYNEQAWLWLSAAVETLDDQRTCLENVLAINPDNERARNGLQLITQQITGGSPAPAAPPAPSAPTGFEDMPTSAEWALPADDEPAPAAGTHPLQEPSSAEYDAWLSNLNLAKSENGHAEAKQSPAAPDAGTPFGDFNLFNTDQEIFTAGPFSTTDFEEIFTPVTPSPVRDNKPPAPPSAILSPGAEGAMLAPDQKVGALFAEPDDDFSDLELEALDTTELFSYIPDEIKPTRLPGTRERHPVALVIGLIVLILLNLGAAALLVYRLALA